MIASKAGPFGARNSAAVPLNKTGWHMYSRGARLTRRQLSQTSIVEVARDEMDYTCLFRCIHGIKDTSIATYGRIHDLAHMQPRTRAHRLA